MKHGHEVSSTDHVHDGDCEKWVYDSSLDHKGRVPLRALTGVWKASLFIIAIEFSERLSYFGIATSLIVYLSKVIHQDLETAAKSVNYWSGVTTMLPLLGGFVADAYLGRFSTVLLSSLFYLFGLILLTMSRFVPSMMPCGTHNISCEGTSKVHKAVFFCAIYLISIGTGGHKPALESFGADQFDDDHPEERKKKMSFFNWWNFGFCSGLLLGVTVIVYIQELNWGVADIILSVVMAMTIVVFIVGRPFYRFRKATGSPLTPMVKVAVAAFRKRHLASPCDEAQFYEDPVSYKAQGRLLSRTHKLKFLEKAAINENLTEKKQSSSWRLVPIRNVEETKLIINMIPIWLASLPFGLCVAQSSTFFIKQAVTLNRKLTNDFIIPPASIHGISAIGMIFSVTLYEKVLAPILRKRLRNERGLKFLQRIGIGMIFSVLAMVVAALIEKKRLKVAKQNGYPKTGFLPMSVFWLAPQFVILGFGDGFTLVGLQEYFYDQVPDSMRSLGIAFYLSVIGAANFISSLLITVVNLATKSKDGRGWIGKDLNSSRLDYFYLLLAAINGANLFVYVFLARRYSYKNVQRKADVDVDLDVADCHQGDHNAV